MGVALHEVSRLDVERLHQYVLRHNWDNDAFGLQLALKNPRLALGTALAIYWLGRPHFYRQWATRKDVPKENRELFDLLEAARKAVKKGLAPRGIAFDPRKVRGKSLFDDEYPEQKKVRELPDFMCVATDGKAVLPLGG